MLGEGKGTAVSSRCAWVDTSGEEQDAGGEQWSRGRAEEDLENTGLPAFDRTKKCFFFPCHSELLSGSSGYSAAGDSGAADG